MPASRLVKAPCANRPVRIGSAKDQAGPPESPETAQNDGPAKRRLDSCIVTSGLSLREARQSRTKRNANDAKRQLHNTVM